MDFPDLLRKNGLRVTQGRIALLEALALERKPVTVDGLKERLSEPMDTVTLYRALEALRALRIVARTDLQHGHAHYELLAGREHHHHAICSACGAIEDIEVTHAAKPEQEAERAAKGFATIDAYTLEFFGTCRGCA